MSFGLFGVSLLLDDSMVNLIAMHRHFCRRIDSDAYLISFYSRVGDSDVITDVNSLTR